MKKFFKGFIHAFDGLRFAFKTQANFRFHIAAAIIAVALGITLKITQSEWLFLSLSIALVLAAELFNTAIEQLSDAVDKNLNLLIKHAKDTAAAAVLLCAVFSVVVGSIVFIPKLIVLLL